MIGPDQYITYTLLEEPGLTIRESTERERAQRWPPPFGGSMPSDVPKYVVVALAHEHEHNWICSVFGLPQGGETREEAVFWAERFASKNGYRFVPPEGWEDVVGALSPEDDIEGSGRDHTLARSTDPKTSHAADAAIRNREGKTNVVKPGSHRALALECFEFGPLIAEDVKAKTGIDGIWKRVSDLKRMGFIQTTGETRTSREGRQAELYELTDAGWAALARLR